MKRLIALLVLMLLLGGMALAQEETFSPGQPHTHTVDFRLYFETMTASIGDCSLSIQQKIYDAEQAQAILDVVERDLATLAQLTGQPCLPHTIYVAEKLFAGVQLFEDRLYCRAEDILSGEYREYLAGVAYGLSEPWKRIGLAGCAFGGEADLPALKEYFERAESLDMLTLFAAWFAEDFAASADLNAARQTAQALTGYILQADGLDGLRPADSQAYRQQWLSSLGVERDYHAPYPELDGEFTYGHSASYPLIIRTENGIELYLSPIPDVMDTPEQVYLLTYEAVCGPQQLIDGLRADAPEYAQAMKDNLDAGQIKIYMQAGEASYANWASREVHLAYPGSILHELVHVLARVYTAPDRYYMDRWKTEGLAEYLTLRYRPSALLVNLRYRQIAQMDLQPAPDDSPEIAEAKQHLRLANEMYLEQAEFPQGDCDVDVFLYERMLARALQSMEIQHNQVSSLSDTFNSVNSGSGATQRFINGLSYAEAFDFTAFLIENYSLDSFLDFCSRENVFFEDYYGLSYEEAIELWAGRLSLSAGPTATCCASCCPNQRP